jgi:hypothetical protein
MTDPTPLKRAATKEEPNPDPSPAFDQYYPGGVMKQMADALGGIAYNQDVPGGCIEQLRVATDPTLELDQHGPGHAHGQIGYTIVTGAVTPPPDPGEGTGEGEELPGGELPGPQPRSAGVVDHESISIQFDAQLGSAVPYPEDFLVMADSAPVDVDFVGVGSDLVTLTALDDLPTGVTAMSVSYTPGTVPLVGKDGTPVAKFSNLAVDGAA